VSSPIAQRLVAELGTLYGVTRRAASQADGRELTSTQRIALAEVVDGGPLRLSALAARMGTTAPTASRTVETLLAAGLVDRVEDVRDRRAVQIEATGRGRRVVEARRARLAAVLDAALAGLAEQDRERLVELIGLLNAELRAAAGDEAVPSGALIASG
jgi:DNA-binding MarR family transcriptional regulator